MARLYLFLAEHANTKTLLETFKTQPAIFIPSSSSNAREDVVEGSLMSLDNVFWGDPTGALTMLHTLHGSSRKKRADGVKVPSSSVKALSGYYPELRTFFVEQSLIREKPDFYGYVGILKQLAAVTSPSFVLNEVVSCENCIAFLRFRFCSSFSWPVHCIYFESLFFVCLF